MTALSRHLDSLAMLAGFGFCVYLQTKYPNLPHHGNLLLLLLMVLGLLLAGWSFRQKMINR